MGRHQTCRRICLYFITVGRIIRASTSTADIRLAPPVNWWLSEPLKSNQFQFVHQGVQNQDAQQAVDDRRDSGQKLYRRTGQYPLSRLGPPPPGIWLVMTPIGNSNQNCQKVPTMEVSMTNRMPKLGMRCGLPHWSQTGFPAAPL